MIGPCPYVCNNKAQDGYCKTTSCINPAYNKFVYSEQVMIFDQRSPCANCTNNPINGGSGICHCILGNPTRY